MTDVILHAGLPKTGTTSLQQAWAAMRDRLAEDGVCAPALDVHKVLSTITRDFADCPRMMVPVMPDEASYLGVRSRSIAALEELVKAGWNKVILSSEMVSGAAADGLARLATAFRDCDRVRCVVHVRSPSSFYPSSVQQGEKASGVLMTPGDFNRNQAPLEFRYRSCAFIDACREALTDDVSVPCFGPCWRLERQTVRRG